jgi:diaminopimelate epimerase
MAKLSLAFIFERVMKKLKFTKMQGAGNDFVVLDASRAPICLSPEQYRRLGDRRFGVGADQILMIEPSSVVGVDFNYRIFNGGSGDEVEHCGNGARCFVRYVHDKGLSDKRSLRVQTMNTTLVLHLQDDGRVTVDMNRPIFESTRVPFDDTGLTPRTVGQMPLWPLHVSGHSPFELAIVSMGNPHAVQLVADVDAAPVATLGPLIENHVRFVQRVNAGFMQIVNRSHIKLRVFERGAGETLACGTGACAAAVVGMRMGLLDAQVNVKARGGTLTVAWQSEAHPVLMTGPAETVFEGEIEL